MSEFLKSPSPIKRGKKLVGLEFPFQTAPLVKGNSEMLGADPEDSCGSRPISQWKDLEVLHCRVEDISYPLIFLCKVPFSINSTLAV